SSSIHRANIIPEKCKNKKPAQCANGGFPHPRECSKCVCPSGYGGDLCDRRPPDGCGSELEAGPDWKTLTDLMMNVRTEEYLDGYEKCHYWIKSPNNTFIEIRIKSLTPAGPVLDGCVEAGVEIKTQQNQLLTGYRYDLFLRFCYADHERLVLKSCSNLVPVIFYSRSKGMSKISLEYRHGIFH
ncbi:hypothetical protein ANCCAN_06387, partial [Ancylostoma caninum]